ncbi:MAG: filamentous hemagglutinin, partial [Deltaproteobacteria bacterium]|nr:filamentous hemagglutinin [Deltaproteobacteria bacterium]
SLTSITNQGNISANDGGYVVFISPTINNSGNITANSGSVNMASGDDVTLTFANNGLINLVINKETAAEALGIDNAGTITADGGQVIISAQIAGDLLKTVVNNTGVIQARTIENKNGTIKLLGGMENNAINVGGTLDASAPACAEPCRSGGDGGFIETSAASVKVADGAVITTAAPSGTTGEWLIDPTDYTIAASGGDITGSQLSTYLGDSNVNIFSSFGATGTNGDVNVNDAVSWSANTTLTLSAYRNININSNITATGNTAGLTLTPNNGAGGSYSLNNGAVITLSGSAPSLTIAGIAYAVLNEANGGVTALQNMVCIACLSGRYALGSNIDASNTYMSAGW